MRLLTLIFGIVLLLITAPCLTAQPRTVAAGDHVRVTAPVSHPGKPYVEGEILRITDGVVQIRRGRRESPYRIARPNIEQVELRAYTERRRSVRPFLVGTLVGAGLATAVGGVEYASCTAEDAGFCGMAYLLGVTLGAAVGGGVGLIVSLVGTRDSTWEVARLPQSARSRLLLRPTLRSPGGTGAGLTLQVTL